VFKWSRVMGETYAIRDSYLFTLAQLLEGIGVDPARFQNILEFRSRKSERPAVNSVPADERS
jgi:hypothetical protein